MMKKFSEKANGSMDFDDNGSPTNNFINNKGQRHTTNMISEVNEEETAYGMPLTEQASLQTMNEMSAGVSQKLANIFNQSSNDFDTAY